MNWYVGEARSFRWVAGGGMLVLLAGGWRIVAVDDRYGSVLMERADG